MRPNHPLLGLGSLLRCQRAKPHGIFNRADDPFRRSLGTGELPPLQIRPTCIFQPRNPEQRSVLPCGPVSGTNAHSDSCSRIGRRNQDSRTNSTSFLAVRRTSLIRPDDVEWENASHEFGPYDVAGGEAGKQGGTCLACD
jgi:hypothetical protein